MSIELPFATFPKPEIVSCPMWARVVFYREASDCFDFKNVQVSAFVYEVNDSTSDEDWVDWRTEPAIYDNGVFTPLRDLLSDNGAIYEIVADKSDTADEFKIRRGKAVIYRARKGLGLSVDTRAWREFVAEGGI
ncbi:hypothetical protein ACL02T_20310 [Pseudonocardia sp. RS010]|uniref:hypothetical protein n=1 Tax=Pseudonocardia sp. RS010 TaxID=3385979 RepID=UPI0039A0159B